MRRVHPKTGEIMEEHRNKDGSLWGPSLKLYSNLKPPTNLQPPPEGFYTYVPEPKPVMVPVAQGVVQAAVEARKKRILEKESGRAVAAKVDNSNSTNDSQSSTHLIPIIAPVIVSDDVRATDEQDEVDQYGEDRLRAKKTRREMQPVPELMVLDIPPGVGASRSEVGGVIIKRKRVIGKQRP